MSWSVIPFLTPIGACALSASLGDDAAEWRRQAATAFLRIPGAVRDQFFSGVKAALERDGIGHSDWGRGVLLAIGDCYQRFGVSRARVMEDIASHPG